MPQDAKPRGLIVTRIVKAKDSTFGTRIILSDGQELSGVRSITWKHHVDSYPTVLIEVMDAGISIAEKPE